MVQLEVGSALDFADVYSDLQASALNLLGYGRGETPHPRELAEVNVVAVGRPLGNRLKGARPELISPSQPFMACATRRASLALARCLSITDMPPL